MFWMQGVPPTAKPGVAHFAAGCCSGVTATVATCRPNNVEMRLLLSLTHHILFIRPSGLHPVTPVGAVAAAGGLLWRVRRPKAGATCSIFAGAAWANCSV